MLNCISFPNICCITFCVIDLCYIAVVVKVVFEYEAKELDELTLHVGDIIQNCMIVEKGWMQGELNGKRGVFPDNFVVEITPPPPPTPGVCVCVFVCVCVSVCVSVCLCVYTCMHIIRIIGIVK